MYVLEGSTLGAQFIARHVRTRFQLTYGSGASFFNAYGDQVPSRWADFRSFLGVHADEVCGDELTNVARQTFEALERWLTFSR
jgi:heme oxygenase